MEKYEGHIGLKEGTILVFTVLASLLFSQTPQVIITLGGPAGWQVALVSTLAGLVLVLPIGALALRFPGLGLAEISQTVVGPFLGPLLTLTTSVWLGAATVLTLRGFTETFVMTILPQTPPSVLIVVSALLAVFASYKGAEAIARTAQLLLPVIALGVLLVLLFSLPRVDTKLLYPFWGFGLDKTLSGGIFAASLSAEVIMLLAFGYAFRDGRTLHRSSIVGILLFGLSTTATIAVLVGTLGSTFAAQNTFALFSMARLIYLGRFVQRLESLIVMFWIFAVLIRLSALLHATVVSLAGALRLPAYRPLLFPLIPILSALALLPKDFVTILQASRDWLRPASFGILAIPLLLWLVAVIRGKEGRTHEA